MKNLALFLVCGFFWGCHTSDQGNLTGVVTRQKINWSSPQEMIFVPGGTFQIGPGAEEHFAVQDFTRTVTISNFYIDQTEITNHQWRRYVEDVTDTFSLRHPEFLEKEIFPDTTVWARDFTHHFGDPMMNYYYQHPAFDLYPVVGVSWKAVQHYCEWRTKKLHQYQLSKVNQRALGPRFRLPTEAEWEWAASGAKQHKEYPWGGPYTSVNNRPMANFKPGRGDYIRDGFHYTAPIKTYPPNNLGIFDMAGNVAEWCLDDWSESHHLEIFDVNPVYKSGDPNSPKIVKGGSWKDIAHFMRVDVDDHYHPDSVSSFVGFRCVYPALY